MIQSQFSTSIEMTKNVKDPVILLSIVTGAARRMEKAAVELPTLQKSYNGILVARDVQRGKAVENEFRRIWLNVHSVAFANMG